jgi:Capsular polysaccharide synthesis protein
MEWVILFLVTLLIIILVIKPKVSIFTEDSDIPKIIWTYWVEEDLPELVKSCIESWKKYNPDYDIRVLNKKTVQDWVPGLKLDELKMNDSPARESDFVRLSILPIYGGIWADASILMNRSMDYIRDIQREKKCELVGYYLDSFTSRPEYPVIESWFFASVPNSKFVKEWADEFMKINSHSSVGEYVDAKRRQGVDMQNIKWLEYLAIHVSAQTIMQAMSPHEVSSKLHLMKAEDGPLSHVPANDGDLPKSIKDVCKNSSPHPFIKLRSTDRRAIENDKSLSCIYK